MSDWIERPDPLPEPPAASEPPPYDPGQFGWQLHDPDPLPQDPLPFPDAGLTTDPADQDTGYLPPTDPGWATPTDDPATQQVAPDDDAAQVAVAVSVLDDRDAGDMTAQSVPDAMAPVEDHAAPPGAEDANVASAAVAGDDGTAGATVTPGNEALPDSAGTTPAANESWRDEESLGTQPGPDVQDNAAVPIGDDPAGAGSWRSDADDAGQHADGWAEPAAADGGWAAAVPVTDDPDVAAVDTSTALLFEETAAPTAAAEPDPTPGEGPPDRHDPSDRDHEPDGTTAAEPRDEPSQDDSDHGRERWPDEAPAREVVDAGDRRTDEEGYRAEDDRHHDEARAEEERREAEHRSDEDATALAIGSLEEADHARAPEDAGAAGPDDTDYDADYGPEEAVSSPHIESSQPTEGMSFQDAGDDEIDHAVETIGPAGAMLSDLMLHQQQPEALAALRESNPSIRSRPARTPPGVEKNPKPGWQSAHIVPTSAMEDLTAYNARKAITRMLPTGKGHVHTLFDKYWEARCAELIASGRETMTVAELQDILGEAALRSGAFSPEEGATVAAMAKLELFVERGLRAEDELGIPGLRGRR